MKRRSDTFLMIAAGVVVAVFIAAAVFQVITERNKAAAVARLKLPQAVALHESKTHPAATSDRKDSQSTEDASRESIAKFADLSSRVEAFFADSRWKQQIDDVFWAKPFREWTNGERTQAETMMAEAAGLLADLRIWANAGGPAAELDFSKGYPKEFSHLRQLRACAWLLQIDAEVSAHKGDYSNVVEDIVTTMKLGAAVRDEPIILSQLSRMAYRGMAYGIAEESLPVEGLSPDVAQRLIEYAGQEESRETFAQSFAGEAFFVVAGFEQLREGDRTGPLGTMGLSSTEKLFVGLYGTVIGRPWLNMDETVYATTAARIQELAQLPYYEIAPIIEQVHREIRNLPYTRVHSRVLLYGLPRVIEAKARDEAMLALMRVGLSVEQHNAQNGSYPASLDALAPILGGSVPVDPFTGQPFVYRPSGSGFVLYSVGRDQVDDGGVHNYQTGDIVWRAQPK